MNTKMINVQAEAANAEDWSRPSLLVDFDAIAAEQSTRRSLWIDPQAQKSMEDAMGSLVASYLVAALNFRNLPLKEFMDTIERQILLSGLRLTGGHQKNAAVILGLKPTALFEKMRKHCINSRKIKLSGKLGEAQPQAEE
jgi:DNA-binding NtrC family response regulator